MHKRFALILLAAAGVSLAACDSPRSGPPVSGTSPGPSARPLEQESAQQTMQQPGTSAGPAAITGARGDGRPTVTRTGPGTGSVAAPASDRPSEPQVPRSRGN
jgi:hypothetical protein